MVLGCRQRPLPLLKVCCLHLKGTCKFGKVPNCTTWTGLFLYQNIAMYLLLLNTTLQSCKRVHMCRHKHAELNAGTCHGQRRRQLRWWRWRQHLHTPRHHRVTPRGPNQTPGLRALLIPWRPRCGSSCARPFPSSCTAPNSTHPYVYPTRCLGWLDVQLDHG